MTDADRIRAEAAGYRLVMRFGSLLEKAQALERRKFVRKWYKPRDYRSVMPCNPAGENGAVREIPRRIGDGPLAVWMP